MGSVPYHVHGTVNGYSNYRCRCDRCRLAISDAYYARIGKTPPPRPSDHEKTGRRPSMLDVMCWCEARVVVVSNEDVKRGMTRSCGLRACDEIHRGMLSVVSNRND